MLFKLCFVALIATAPVSVQAAGLCSTANTSAKCATPPKRVASEVIKTVDTRPEPVFSPGDILPQGRYYRFLNTQYHGLPPVQDDWVYYEAEHHIYRVRRTTMEVIAVATGESNATF